MKSTLPTVNSTPIFTYDGFLHFYGTTFSPRGFFQRFKISLTSDYDVDGVNRKALLILLRRGIGFLLFTFISDVNEAFKSARLAPMFFFIYALQVIIFLLIASLVISN